MFMLTLYAVGLPTLVQAGGELALVGLGTGGVKQVWVDRQKCCPCQLVSACHSAGVHHRQSYTLGLPDH